MRVHRIVTASAVVFGLTVLAPGDVFGHCDSLDGPVVKAAQKALDTLNLTPVLIWIGADDEQEIRAVFDRTLAVRGLSPEAKELADRHFFETVVRVHRAGEGAPYTGLKPAGRDFGPAIPAADQALDDGSADPVVQLLTKALQNGVRRHFEEAMSARNFKPGDVSAGRRYIKAYVEFIHYVERLYEAITLPAHGHFAEGVPAEKHY